MHDISLRKEGADIKKDVVVSSNLDLLFLSPLALRLYSSFSIHENYYKNLELFPYFQLVKKLFFLWYRRGQRTERKHSNVLLVRVYMFWGFH